MEVAGVYNHIFYDIFYDIYSSPVLFLVRWSGAAVSARGRRQDRRGDAKRKVEIGANLVFWTNKMEKGEKKTQRWSKKKYDGMSCFFKVTLDHIDPESGKKLGEGFVGCMPWNFKMSIPEHSDRNVMKPRHLKRWHVWEFELMWLFLPETLDGISYVVCQELQGWISDDQRALTPETKGMGIYEWNIDRMKIRSSLCLHLNSFFVYICFCMFLQSLLV